MNVVVRYTISSKVWSHRSYPSQFKASTDYNDGSTFFQLIGDENGKIYKVNIGNDDDGTPISYSLVHRWYNVDGFVATRKHVRKLAFAHEGGSDGKVSYQVDTDKHNDWTKNIGILGTSDTSFKSLDIKGRRWRPRLSGISKGEPFTYKGFEILEVTSELII